MTQCSGQDTSNLSFGQAVTVKLLFGQADIPMESGGNNK